MKLFVPMVASILLFAAVSKAQTLKVSGGAVLVPNGSVTSDYYNFTNLGPVAVSSSKTDAIFNIYTDTPISIPTKPALSGPHASEFEIVMSATVATPSNPAGFTIRFSPQLPGPKSATVTINSNASPYTFDISGIGVDGPLDPAPNPEFSLGKSKYKGKVNKNTGEVTITASDGFTNQGQLPAGPAMVTFYYSADNILDPNDDFLAESLVQKPVAIGKDSPKGPKYKLGTGKMKAVVPSQNGHIITQVRLLDSTVVESNYRWNTVHYPLGFLLK